MGVIAAVAVSACLCCVRCRVCDVLKHPAEVKPVAEGVDTEEANWFKKTPSFSLAKFLSSMLFVVNRAVLG